MTNQMITIILLIIQIYSDKPTMLEANPLCTDDSRIVYHISEQVICVPSDEIFWDGFDV